jgi:hypothetical protein
MVRKKKNLNMKKTIAVQENRKGEGERENQETGRGDERRVPEEWKGEGRQRHPNVS